MENRVTGGQEVFRAFAGVPEEEREHVLELLGRLIYDVRWLAVVVTVPARDRARRAHAVPTPVPTSDEENAD
jgi:hypothetical protein